MTAVSAVTGCIGGGSGEEEGMGDGRVGIEGVAKEQLNDSELL